MALRWRRTNARRWTLAAARAGGEIKLVPETDPKALTITQDCPRCGHKTRDRNPLWVIAGISADEAEAEAQAHERAVRAAPTVAQTFTADCRCGQDHPKRTDGDGCGARWYLYISGPPWVVLPGVQDDAPSEEDEAAVAALAKSELERVRKAGDSWRTALAGLITLIAAFSVLEGTKAVPKLSSFWPIVAAVAAGVGLAAAVIGALLAARAAYGSPGEEIQVGQPGAAEAVANWHATEARRAAGAIWWARIATVTSLGLLVFAVGITWFAPKEPDAVVRVSHTGGDPVCGTIKSANQDGIVITDADKRDHTIPLASLAGLSPLADCP